MCVRACVRACVCARAHTRVCSPALPLTAVCSPALTAWPVPFIQRALASVVAVLEKHLPHLIRHFALSVSASGHGSGAGPRGSDGQLSGWLLKEGERNTALKRRWCVLANRQLSYFKKQVCVHLFLYLTNRISAGHAYVCEARTNVKLMLLPSTCRATAHRWRRWTCLARRLRRRRAPSSRSPCSCRAPTSRGGSCCVRKARTT